MVMAMKSIHHLLFNNFYKSLFYILPLIVFAYFTYTFSKNINPPLDAKKVTLPKKEKDIELFNFAYDLEKYLKVNNLDVKNLKVLPKDIQLQIEGDFIKSFKVLDFIENYSGYLDIKKFNFQSLNDNKINLSVDIELIKINNHYKKQDLKEISSNIIYQKNKMLNENIAKSELEIKIDVIVNDSVMINKKWYQVGSFFNNKQITFIKSDHIILNEKGHITKVWIYQNEFTR